MRTVLGFVALLISTLASAQTSSVKITSFLYTGSRTSAAEICGRVTGGTGIEIIQINVDPSSKTPAHYTALVSDDGSFCVVVSTMTGEATVAIRGEPHLDLAVANLDISRDRLASPPPIRNWACRAHPFDSSFPEFTGQPALSRYTAEQNAINSCRIGQRKRCVAGYCYQR